MYDYILWLFAFFVVRQVRILLYYVTSVHKCILLLSWSSLFAFTARKAVSYIIETGMACTFYCSDAKYWFLLHDVSVEVKLSPFYR